MVDLAKIRRKVREKKEGEAKAVAPEASPVAPAASVPEAPPAPEKKKPSKKDRLKAEAAAPEQPAVPAAAPAGEVRATAKLERFRETAGRLSEAMAAPAARTEAGEQESLLQLLTFVMADEQYAIDIEKIAEIIAPREATPVPNAPRPVVGIISLRGTIVTMLDLRRELGHGPAAAIGPETRTIVVDDSGSLAGFLVDRVLRKVEVRPDQVQAHPVVSPAEQSDAIRGVFQSGASLTIVLDVEKLLARG